MSKINIFKTMFANNTNIKTTLISSLRQMVDYRDELFIDNDYTEKLFESSSSAVSSVITMMFDRLRDNDSHKVFSFVDTSRTSKIPTILSLPWLVFDVEAIADYDETIYKSYQSIPELKSKIVLDLVPYITRRDMHLKDNHGFQSEVVKCALVRSYNTFDQSWLNPSLINNLAKFYAISISWKIAKLYNLDYKQQMLIAAVLALFFVHINTISDELNFGSLSRFPQIKSAISTDLLEDTVKSYYYENKRFMLDTVVQVIKDLSPDRLNDFDVSSLIRMNSNNYPNVVFSATSIEYPPYWAFIVLDAIGGNKTSFYHTIKKIGLKRESVELIKLLNNTEKFLV